jgi:RecA-family ATPase
MSCEIPSPTTSSLIAELARNRLHQAAQGDVWLAEAEKLLTQAEHANLELRQQNVCLRRLCRQLARRRPATHVAAEDAHDYRIRPRYLLIHD